jgi:hypothetical protein
MPGFNQTGPAGQGSMTGRRMGKCNPSVTEKSDDKIKNALIGFAAVILIGLTERIWNKIKENRFKPGLKQN